MVGVRVDIRCENPLDQPWTPFDGAVLHSDAYGARELTEGGIWGHSCRNLIMGKKCLFGQQW